MDNKKIIVLYASVGGGHFKAAEGIKNYILENHKNCDVQMIDALKYTNKVIDKIVIKSYVNMAKYSPKMWGELYKFSEKQYSAANFSNAVQMILSNKLLALLEYEQPDCIISTHPFITEMVASLKKREKIAVELNVIMTDYASHKFWELKQEYVDRYFVANNEMKAGLIFNGIDEHKIFVTGIPVNPAFLKEYDKNEIYKEFDLNPNLKTVLLFGGGEYGLSNVKDFFSSLLAVNHNIQIERLEVRNPRLIDRFINEWIPLEEKYFDTLMIKNQADYLIDTSNI
jgi:processive 1,2-diacylglycerol beta-glucosyltransferase